MLNTVVHLVGMNVHGKSFVRGVLSWQNGTRYRDGFKVLWCHSHLVCDLFVLNFFLYCCLGMAMTLLRCQHIGFIFTQNCPLCLGDTLNLHMPTAA